MWYCREHEKTLSRIYWTRFNKGYSISGWNISPSTWIYPEVRLSCSYIIHNLVGTMCTELRDCFLFYSNAFERICYFLRRGRSIYLFSYNCYHHFFRITNDLFSLWSKEFEILWIFKPKFNSFQTVYFLSNFVHRHILRKNVIIFWGWDGLVGLIDFGFGHTIIFVFIS